MGERTLTYPEWAAEMGRKFGRHASPLAPDINQLKGIVEAIANDASRRDHGGVVLHVFQTQLGVGG